MAARYNQPVVAIYGPTASGKSSLAYKIAGRYDGEIISADSRAIYKGMDIATAKASAEEQSMVRHWGIDLVEPGQPYSAAHFKAHALEAIANIRSRGKLPILVGGTGLYMDSVLFDFGFRSEPDPALRQQLDKMDLAQLKKYCTDNNINIDSDMVNKRHLVRAIESKSISAISNSAPAENTIVVAIATNKQVLRTRISQRIEQMFDNGVVEEAIKLGKNYGWDNESMTGNVYRLVAQYIDGGLTRQQLIDKSVIQDWRLAKRQMTWLRRNPYIMWGRAQEVEDYLTAKLNHM